MFLKLLSKFNQGLQAARRKIPMYWQDKQEAHEKEMLIIVTNDDDDVATWKYAYPTAQGDTTGIQEGAIVDDITTPTAEPTHFLFADSFNKTSSDTLKVIITKS